MSSLTLFVEDVADRDIQGQDGRQRQPAREGILKLELWLLKCKLEISSSPPRPWG